MTARMTVDEVVAALEALADPAVTEGMGRFGITPDRAFGVKMPDLRRLAKRAGTDHGLAARLWGIDTRETRILASLVDDADVVTPEQMDEWVSVFDYWEICDQCCMNLFWRTPIAYRKCAEWSSRDEEYVKRAGFALAAVLAWKDKDASAEDILGLLVLVEDGASDPRPMVKKAVDWALRQIGKRDAAYHAPALGLARRLSIDDDRARAWIGRHAVKELESQAVLRRLGLT